MSIPQSELYLKTVFCCIACDGEIVESELDLLNGVVRESGLSFDGLDTREYLQGLLHALSQQGHAFLKGYLSELEQACLSEEEQMDLLRLCFRSIEADGTITASELGFFKKIRASLSISDDRILEEMPDKEDYLLPDIRPVDYFSLHIPWNSLIVDTVWKR